MADLPPAPAMPADEEPQPNALYRGWVMLLNGWGYNWYRTENRMRADDLLVRSRASEHLENAAARLRDLEARYRRAFLPPPSREHPDPDPQHLAAARQFRALAAEILELDTRLRGAAVPPDDRIWRRHRSEPETLRQLGECDVLLVGGTGRLDELVAALPAETAIEAAARDPIVQELDRLRTALSWRGDILSAPPG